MAFAKNFPLENHKHKLNLSLTSRDFFARKFFLLVLNQENTDTYMLRYSHPHLSS